jgi:hypothetical protein
MSKKSVIQFCTLISLCAANLFSQAGIGGIAGVVRDPSGSTVPEASVTIINESKGIRRSAETTGAGIFNATSLVPAAGYSVEVTKPGFSKYQANNITVQVGSTVELDVQLNLATATTSVSVEAAVPIVEDAKSGITDLVNQQQIDNLPINGRRADTFVLLTPGVVRDGTFGLVSFHGISAGNAFLTDGNYTTNSFYSENAGRTRISTQISQDAVQEFQVVSNGYSAEFGRSMSGIVNTVTRSGTNDYHGTLYEFFRNRTLNATDRYATFNPPEWRHQAGGSMGGPIKKDKLFFFGNYELVRRNFPGLNRITTSQIADPTGTFVAPSNCPVNNSTGPTTAQCAAVTSFIQPQMNVKVARTVSSDIGFAKIDYRPGERNAITLGANVMHWDSPHGIQTQGVLTNGNLLGGNGNSTVETRYGNADWTFIISPKALNDFRFGWFKDRLSDPAASDLWPSTGALVISVANAAVGAAAAYPRTYPSEQRFQFSDNLSWTAGSHSLKFGVDTDRTHDYLNQLFNRAGTYTYSTLANFAKDFSAGPGCTAKGVKVGCYTSFTQTFGNPVQDLHTTNFNLYAQDSWKINAKLTLNYGVRWERTFLPQPTSPNPSWAQTGVIPTTNRDFAPRISLSYGLNDRTVIRAGYGLFYAPYITNGIDTLFLGNSIYQPTISVNPTTNSAATPGAPLFPNVVPNAASVPAGTLQITFADPNFHNPYSTQANLAVERQLGWDTDFTASYSYTRGVGLITTSDVNLSGPTGNATYIIQDASGNNAGSFTTPVWTAASKINSAFSNVYDVSNGGKSWYSGLTLQMRKRMSHGFTAQLAYTWSHAEDDAQQSGASTTINYNQRSTYNGNFLLDKGNSATDQRHRFVVNWLWNPTFTTSTSALAKYLINGWQLSSSTTMASAQYTSGTVSVSGNQGFGLLYTSTLNGSGGWNRVPFLPVNSAKTDPEYFVNARISRAIPVNERVRASLLFEAFNLFNTQYNTGINTTAYTASGGILKPQAAFGTGNASQAFPDGTNARRMQAGVRIEF